MEGYNLLCSDRIRKIALWQKGKEFLIVHEGEFGKVTETVSRPTIQEGFEIAEEIFWRFIKAN